jgi:CPA2 family monovalent cation:H+ antiporter-2
MAATTHNLPSILIELGAAIVGLAFLARIAQRWGISAIPLYLVAGLCFGHGGIAPLNLSEEFISIGAEIGVLLLLFMLGLEYSGDDLQRNLKAGLPSGVIDLLLNFPPGLIVGLLLGWRPIFAVLLGGVTYISSSGIIAKILTELKRMENHETPRILSILVLEDLAMAVYLPLVGVVLAGGGPQRIAVSVTIAILSVFVVLYIAVRHGPAISRFAEHESDEIVLLTTLGTVILVAGIAQHFKVSGAIGAFLVGIAVSGPIARQSHRLIAPLRDLFAATFFFFFGLEINPASLKPALPVALLLATVTALTKLATGYISTRNLELDHRGRLRTGITLIARGEFSIVIAGLGVIAEPRLGPLSAAYVLILAILGPVLAKLAK